MALYALGECEKECEKLRAERDALRDLLYGEWKAKIEATSAEGMPVSTERWYFDELLARWLERPE